MTGEWFADTDPCWLGSGAAAELLRRRITVPAGLSVALVAEVARARAQWRVAEQAGAAALDFVVDERRADLGAEGFELSRSGADLTIVARSGAGLLTGFLRLLTVGAEPLVGTHVPAYPVRMLNHWDNMVAGPMGTVERGYAGDSIFFADGAVRTDLTRVRDYARLVASIGINAVAINNVNVHQTETRLLTDHLDGVGRIAAVLAEFGIATYLSVNFASPHTLGDLDTADPLDPRVQAWWARAAHRVHDAVPAFGGFVVKADSEGRPGPFTYGRSHADGANMLAAALAPVGGTVFWRCFVYDHTQDWRDRSTDRARAAYDHFMPLDGSFAPNVVLQVKNGPMDFQVREPVSPLFFGLRDTSTVCEFQVTQEYTGQQRHAVYLGTWWSEVLAFPGRLTADVPPLRDLGLGGGLTGVTAVANIGTDRTWTGHPFAQANLYAYGRLAWDPRLDPHEILREWAMATYDGAAEGVVSILADSWRTYERYTAPLGVGFMVYPHHHYGPSVDGYEYTPWGTYHFADRDGIGVDRTVATGTGYTAQYPPSVAAVYESLDTCPDELLLFFHHVPYSHRLHTGTTVVQHIYDTHFAGVADVAAMIDRWREVASLVPEPNRTEITTRLAEQLRSAGEWCDQVNTYFLRKSGVPDERGRHIH